MKHPMIFCMAKLFCQVSEKESKYPAVWPSYSLITSSNKTLVAVWYIIWESSWKVQRKYICTSSCYHSLYGQFKYYEL